MRAAAKPLNRKRLFPLGEVVMKVVTTPAGTVLSAMIVLIEHSTIVNSGPIRRSVALPRAFDRVDLCVLEWIARTANGASPVAN
jgi:hypothetical protein